MIRFIFCVLAILLISFSAYPCELPKGEVIKVGCSYDCDKFYRFRIMLAGWALGYKVHFVDLHRRPDMKEAMRSVDGILLPGGADIDPKFYLDSITPELRDYTNQNLHLVKFSSEGKKRDPFEYKLVKTYSEEDEFKDLPMLGICRGLQMMSVAQGIPLYLDIATELKIKNRYNKFDRISLRSDSLIQTIYKPSILKGFKLHHQGIRVPYYHENASKYPLVKVTAYSNDSRIAEAIEYTHRPAMGVQYHPERSFTYVSAPVFRWFLTKACEYKTKKDL